MSINPLSIMLGLLSLASPPLLTEAAEAQVQFTLQPDSLIRLDGDGTMHGWSAQTREVSAQWETTTNWLNASTIVPRQLENSLTISIPATSLYSIDLTGKPVNLPEARWIRHAIKSQNHATICFVLDRLTLTKTLQQPAPTWEFTVQGKLALAGVTNGVSFAARLTQPEAAQLKVTGTTELRLKDFAIEPPTIQPAPDSKGKTSPPITVFKDEVKVTFDLVFKPVPAKVSEK